jgi:hypothetical protein
VYPVLAAMLCVSLVQLAMLERAAFTGEASVSLGSHLAAARDETHAPKGPFTDSCSPQEAGDNHVEPVGFADMSDP